MTPVIIIAAFMVASFALAVLIGKCMDTGDAGELHDGATMRDQRRERYRQAREQENAAAAEFEKFGRGGV